MQQTSAEQNPSAAGSGRPSRRRWVIFALAAGTSWMLYLHRYTWNFIRPELRDEYGLSNTQLDSLYSLFAAAYSVGQIPSGIVCDLFGPHLFLSTIIVLWSLVLMLFGTTGNVYALGGFRLLFGTTQAGCYPALSKVTRTWFPLRSRTIVQGLIASFCGRSGGAMSSIVMGTLLIGWLGLGWRAALVVMSLAGVAFAVAFYLLFRDRPEDDPHVNQAERALIREGEAEVRDAPPLLPFRRVWRNRSMRVFVFQQFVNAGADFVYGAIMGSYFIEGRGVERAYAGLLVSLPLWGGAVGGIFGGVVNDVLIRRTGNRRWARSGTGLVGKLIACALLLTAIEQGSPTATAFWFFATKFFSDWTQPTVWGTCTDMGGRYAATTFSIINTSGSVGGMVMPLLGGVLLDYFATVEVRDGVETLVTHYEPAFMLSAALYVLSALCWLFIDCTHSLERKEPLSPGE